MERYLIDVSIDGDCTNLCALAVLNVLSKRGEARILASTGNLNTPLATGCIKMINEYYGDQEIPVGILHRRQEPHPSIFLEPVNEMFCPDKPDGEDAPDSVNVMRRALSEEADGSVIMLVVGCFASFADLLRSGPDAISPYSGMELAEKKISRVVAMAGQFQIFDEKVMRENNIVTDVPDAQYVMDHWKGELVLMDFELGYAIRTLKEFRFHETAACPLRLMYRLTDSDVGDVSSAKWEKGNPSWDPAAVLEAVRPGKYFAYHEYGRIEVSDDGVTTWHEDKDGRQTYLLPKIPTEEVAAVLNDIIFPDWRKYVGMNNPVHE